MPGSASIAKMNLLMKKVKERGAAAHMSGSYYLCFIRKKPFKVD